ncbi:MAG: cyclase family protein [Gemmatimonadaceae bacterium]|nr:cyclase family protein [Gemmatimonadaceae bacterium]
MHSPDLIDISVTLAPGTPEWPGDTPFSCGWTWRMADGESVNLSAITTSPHVGTHADAPLHVRDDAAASEQLPLRAFIGAAVVLDVTGRSGELDRAALRQAGLGRTPARLLLKTERSIASGAFPEAWPALSDACAASLVAEGLLLLGVDCPSVDLRESKELLVHHALFNGGACILENLNLSLVAAGSYDLMAAPVKYGGLDAAPVRAVLRHSNTDT